jgi:low affinity Fe/Cu permease
MQQNWPYIFLVSVAALVFIIFLFRQNMKDRKKLEQKLNNDYPKPKMDEEDVDPEEIPR